MRRVFYLLFLALAAALPADAQSLQSDTFFGRGVDLYNLGYYHDAIQYFEKAKQLDDAEIDPLSVRRGYPDLWIASCYFKLGNIEYAEKFDRFYYRFPPVDRRITVKVDSLLDSAMPDFKEGRFLIALPKFLEASGIEHQLFDKNHFTHIQTDKLISTCHINSGKFDEAVPYLEETRRLIKLNYSETDTLQLSEVYTLFNYYAEKGKYDLAERQRQDLKSILDTNFEPTHPGYVDYVGGEITMLLLQRRWSPARDLIPSHLSTIKRCLGDNPERMQLAVNGLHSSFQNCGRWEECEFINRLGQQMSLTQLPRDIFNLKITNCTNLLNLKRFDDALITFNEANEVFTKLDSSERQELKSTLDCMECFILMSSGRTDEAKDLFINIGKNYSIDDIEKNITSRLIYYFLKLYIGIELADYEGVALAADKCVEPLDTNNINNINLFALQACMHTFAGNYDKARNITRNTINVWKNDINGRKALFRLEKDTADINAITKMFDKNLTNAVNVTDSAIYVIREIKSEYILLKSTILKSKNRYQIDHDYYLAISDYAHELVKNKKYPEAQEVMDKWIADWQVTFNGIDRNSESNDEQIARVSALLTLDSALRFRCSYCYEKGDPAGVKAYQDLFEFTKYNSPTDRNELKSIMISLYRFTGDDKGLLDYISEMAGEDREKISTNNLITIAHASERVKDFDKAIFFWKKIANQAIANSDVESGFMGLDPLYAIDRIIRISTKEQHDTIQVFEYLSGELWPLLDSNQGKHLEYLCRSIRKMRYSVRDDSFLKYIRAELERNPEIAKQSHQKAAVLLSTAYMMGGASKKYSKLAIEFAQRARNLVKEDEPLFLTFSISMHELMFHLGVDFYDRNIRLGNEIIKIMAGNESYFKSFDYDNLIEMQLSMLRDKSRPDDMIAIGAQYFNLKKTEDISIFNETHPLYSEISWINSNTYFLNDLTHDFIREKTLYAILAKNLGNAPDCSLSVIKDYLRHLETSMDASNIATYECDGLISRTSMLAEKFQTDSLCIYAYDVSLLCKGLQLRSNNAIKAIIRNSGHKGALRKYEELESVMRKMASASTGRLDSLAKRRDTLEKDLQRLSSSFGDYKNSLNTSWKEVRKSLNGDDLAIEFTMSKQDYYYTKDTGFNYGYYACVLKKDMDTPKIIFLAPKDSITSDIDIYSNKRLSSIIMGKLKPYLKGIRNIYYSPIGEFNRIAVESLPLPNDNSKTLSSKYNILRVSSTRELIVDKFNVEGNGAVVYGGLNYDTSIKEMVADSKFYASERSVSPIIVDDFDIENLRGAIRRIPYLPGTKFEAEGVHNTLNTRNDPTMRADLYIGNAGTESSFKSLSGQRKRLLHIATHGFYFTEKDFSKISKIQDDRQNLKSEDKSLLRSGLFFAGATNRYLGKEIPTGVDDGILTSREIAGIDLAGLDLCVLSACQTAQGDISSEGVYGLQRAFKKAGAKSILMSLWKVDDDATVALMNEFYRQWILNKKSKYRSLELAKQAVRNNKDKGWDNPKFWSAFILLDGMD